jgi:protein-tyrosine-phosphatase
MKVLFVCWGNSGRSQFAEAFFGKVAPHHSISSAGTNADERNKHFGTDHVPEQVMQVMKEIGFDMSAHRRKQLTKKMADEADLIIAILDKKFLPDYILNSPKMRHWDILDPKGMPLEFHRVIRDQVKEAVGKLVKEIN